MDIRNLSTDELKALVREAVEEALCDLLEDPDHDLRLREDVRARLTASMAEVESGARGVPLEEVMGRINQAR